jgi:hypothetical protein
MLTAKKINVEARKTERNLHHLVLLCNTYDAQTLHLLDIHGPPENGSLEPDEKPPAYELYSSPNVEVSVTECSAPSESSDGDEELWFDTDSNSKVELVTNDDYALCRCRSRYFMPKLCDGTSDKTLKSSAVVKVNAYWVESKHLIEQGDSPWHLKMNRCSSIAPKVVPLATSLFQGYAALIKFFASAKKKKKWTFAPSGFLNLLYKMVS